MRSMDRALRLRGWSSVTTATPSGIVAIDAAVKPRARGTRPTAATHAPAQWRSKPAWREIMATDEWQRNRANPRSRDLRMQAARGCGCEFGVTNSFDSRVTSPTLSCASHPDLGEGSCNCAIAPACIHHGCRREYRCRVLARVRLASRVHSCCCRVGHRSQLASRSVPQLQATKRHTPTATCCGPSAARNRSQSSWGRWQALACRLRG